MELREVTKSIEIPKNTGIEGFVVTIRELLRRSRIQQISIEASGKVSYRRLVREDEPEAIDIDLETVTPHGILANAEIEELVLPPHLPAAVVLGRMFDRFAIDQVHPIAFVSGIGTVFWDWYRVTTKAALHSRSAVFGLPLILDRHIPETALILCGASSRSTSLIDTTVALKLEMETSILKPPNTTVEIL